MPVVFGNPNPKERFYPIVIPEPGRKYYVRIGTNADLHRTTELHWVAKLNRMVPCLQEECGLCPMSTRVTTYVPAMIFLAPGPLYKPSILPIGDGTRDVLTQDLGRWLFEMKRKNGKNSPLLWECHAETPKEMDPFPGFGIEPSLFRAWGIKIGGGVGGRPPAA